MTAARLTRRTLDALASYWLACVVMILMLVLTALGTVDQKRLGLYEVQQRYFTSLFFLYEFPGGLRIPMPGAYLLMAIFSVNLLLGSLIRTRWRWSNAGMLMMHGGVLFLMVAALITHHFSIEGHMTLAPGETSDQFLSYHDWDLVIADPRPADHDVVYRIPAERIAAAHPGRPQTFTNPAFPFDVVVEAYYPNSVPQPVRPGMSPPTPVVEGFYLQPLARDPQNENNAPGVYLLLRHKDDGHAHRAILWGMAREPLVETIEGAPWRLTLERRRWRVPFAVTLQRFTRELHPGTTMAAAFRSDVIVRADGHETPITISMNRPLRRQGYTFFQASYQEDPRTGQFKSTFAVVRNPADHYPLYALIIVGAGMLWHFSARLMRYLRTAREGTA